MAVGAPSDHNVPQDLVLKMHRCQGYRVGIGDMPEETYGPLQHKAELLTWWI
jgi:hypothetical protein